MKKVIVFESVHYTIKADKLLPKYGVKYELVQTPRHISTDCGMSLEATCEQADKIYNILIDNGFEVKMYENIYK